MALAGCSDTLPDKASLHPEASNVEIISDVPNREIYEPAGEVTAQIIGRDNGASLREAFNSLRNQAAAKGATFVAVEEVSSRAAWDFSGRTIVTLVGTAYRTK
jgi:imidazoleglycerol phosphate dehydratase HisB